MLEDAARIRRVIIATGYVDLRKGIDGLAQIIGARYNQNPFEKGTLFLFLRQAFGPHERAAVDGGRLPAPV